MATFHFLWLSNIPSWLPRQLNGKESACSAEVISLILGSGRSPGEGNGSPLQYSCWENHMDRGAWWATVHWVTKSRTQLSYFTFTFFILIFKMEEKKQQFWHIMLDYVKKGKNTTDTKKKVLCRAWRRCWRVCSFCRK